MAEAERGILAAKDRSKLCQGYRHERTASEYRVDGTAILGTRATDRGSRHRRQDGRHGQIEA